MDRVWSYLVRGLFVSCLVHGGGEEDFINVIQTMDIKYWKSPGLKVEGLCSVPVLSLTSTGPCRSSWHLLIYKW